MQYDILIVVPATEQPPSTHLPKQWDAVSTHNVDMMLPLHVNRVLRSRVACKHQINHLKCEHNIESC